MEWEWVEPSHSAASHSSKALSFQIHSLVFQIPLLHLLPASNHNSRAVLQLHQSFRHDHKTKDSTCVPSLLPNTWRDWRAGSVGSILACKQGDLSLNSAFTEKVKYGCESLCLHPRGAETVGPGNSGVSQPTWKGKLQSETLSQEKKAEKNRGHHAPSSGFHMTAHSRACILHHTLNEKRLHTHVHAHYTTLNEKKNFPGIKYRSCILTFRDIPYFFWLCLRKWTASLLHDLNPKVRGILSFFYLFLSYVYVCLSECLHEYYKCAVPAEASRRHRIPWNWAYGMVISCHLDAWSRTSVFCKSGSALTTGPHLQPQNIIMLKATEI